MEVGISGPPRDAWDSRALPGREGGKGRQRVAAPVEGDAIVGGRTQPTPILSLAKPSGEIIENPITSNFREGLTVLQYFVSITARARASPTPRSRPRTRGTSPGAWWTSART